MGKTHFGTCCVCGKKGNMTFEHIPPRQANNEKQIKKILDPIGFFESEQKIDDKLQSVAYKLGNQKGMGGYTLCRGCNNFFGSKYATEFITFYKELADFFANHHDEIVTQSKNGYLDITLVANINFFRFQKQVMSMLMSTSNGIYKESFKNYLLNEQNTDFPSENFKVIMNGYLDSSIVKQTGQMLGINSSGTSEIVGSEIQVFPLGFTLVELNGSENDRNNGIGLDITNWAKLEDCQQKREFTLRTYIKSQPFSYYLTGVTPQ
ncbi:hypothetical protein [Leuconostoc pseudomesenteroides]|uniref:hypothetical protein n=1 Tax=Leuconostoc pseudomesenteroides TaxID=33968 RepID=UPI0039E7C419